MNTISTVAAFARNPSTGVLTQLPGTAGCISDSGTGGTCTDGTALNGALRLAVSPDSVTVYVSSFMSDAVSVLARNPATGALTQLGGTAGCLSDDGSGGVCTDVAALAGVGAVEPSPDGTNLYVVLNGGVAVLARDAATGALTQAPGTNSCLTEWGMGGGGCADGVALMDPTGLALSPDGRPSTPRCGPPTRSRPWTAEASGPGVRAAKASDSADRDRSRS
jgi:DNA-binding beta-propeller fold protein YncE